MSIRDTIKALEASGKLTRYAPRSRAPSGRRLYLADTALRDLTDNSSAVNVLVGRGSVEAALTQWTTKGRVYGNRKGGNFIKRLILPPPEVWEIRVTAPVNKARLFGRFAEPDTLILTKFHTRGFLGDKGSNAWQTTMQDCEKKWIELFKKTLPFSGASIHDYVTENCDDFPI